MMLLGSLKTSVARAGAVFTMLMFFVGLRAAIVGGMANIAFDTVNNPAVRLAWLLVVQIVRVRLSKPNPTANQAQRTMRRPQKVAEQLRQRNLPAEESIGESIGELTKESIDEM